MAAVVQLVVELDEKQLADGSKKATASIVSIGDAADKHVGGRGRKAFQGFETDTFKAHNALRLFERTLGVEMPRAMSTVIAHSKILGPLFAGLFSASVFAASLPIMLETFKKIGEGMDYLAGNTENVKKNFDEVKEANEKLFTSFKTKSEGLKFIQLAQQMQTAAEKQVTSIQGINAEDVKLAAGLNGLQGILGAVTAKYTGWQGAADQAAKAQKRLRETLEHDTEVAKEWNKQIDKANAELDLIGKKGFAKIAQEESNRIKEIVAEMGSTSVESQQLQTLAHKKASLERIELQKQERDETRKIQNEVTIIGLTGIAIIMAKERQATVELRHQLDEQEIDKATYFARIKLAHERSLKEREDLERKYHEETLKIEEDYGSKHLQGFAKIEADTQAKIAEERRKFMDEFGGLPTMSMEFFNAVKDLERREVAIVADGENQKAELRRSGLDETMALEKQAAVARVATEQQATVQIILDYQEQIRKLDELHSVQLISDTDYQRRRAAVDTITNRKIYDEHKALVEKMASDLEGVFDDITSGNIGKRIINNFKHLFFIILANWLTTLQGMGQSAGGLGGGGGFSLGGILGSILLGRTGGVFGAPTAGGTSTGGAGGGVPPGVGGNAFLSTGIGSLTNIAIGGAGAGGSGGGGLSSVASAGAGGLLGRLLGMGKMGVAAGLGGLGAVLGGKALGGAAGAAGAGISALGLLAVNNPGILGPLAALGPAGVAALGGGLLGFGVGSNHGMLAGALAGAGAGVGTAGIMMLLGASLGGPIGLAIAGIVGLLGGIFGGLFGGSKRRKQAEKIKTDMLAQIQAIVNAYKGFQMDFPSAMTNLDALDQQAHDALFKLKGEGRKEYERNVAPAINSAKATIMGYETERQRRAGLVFGPPQFHTGGFVAGSKMLGFKLQSGETMAILQQGEYVVNKKATMRNRGALDAMNFGGAASAVSPIIHINTLDAKSFRYWLRSGGGHELAQASTGASMEGGF